MKRGKHWQKLAYGVVGVVFISLFSFFHFSNFLTVKHVSCEVIESSCPDYLVAELETLKGKSFFFSDFPAAVEKISQFAPSFQNPQVEKELPNRLSVTFSPAQTVYVLQQTPEVQWKVNEVGMIVDTGESSGLPMLQFATAEALPVSLGEKVPEHVHAAILRILDILKRENIPYSQVSIVSSEEGRMTLKDSRQVEFRWDESELAFMKLQYILSSLDKSQLNEPIGTIDLRFQHPILKAQQKSSTQ